MKQVLAKTSIQIQLETIFVGGGTPTALNEKQLDVFVQLIEQNLSYESKIEYTFEANPGDLSEKNLKVLYDSGVNRLSFGVQTFDRGTIKENWSNTSDLKMFFVPLKVLKKLVFKILVLI